MRSRPLVLVLVLGLGAAAACRADRPGSSAPGRSGSTTTLTTDGAGPTGPPATTSASASSTATAVPTTSLPAFKAEAVEEAAVRFVVGMLTGADVAQLGTVAAVGDWEALGLPRPSDFAGGVALDTEANERVDGWLSCPGSEDVVRVCIVLVTPGPGDDVGPLSLEVDVRPVEGPFDTTTPQAERRTPVAEAVRFHPAPP